MPGPITMEIGGGQNSWAARQRKLKMETVDDDAEISRKLKSLLNKLSSDNFDRIYLLMTEVGISNDSQVKILMKEVFEKAIGQHFFIEVYTKLIIRLNDWIKANFSSDQIDFRKILVNECQNTFSENEHLEINVSGANVDDRNAFADIMKTKNRIIGNLKFTGGLVREGLVSRSVVFMVTEDLLEKNTDFHYECLVTTK